MLKTKKIRSRNPTPYERPADSIHNATDQIRRAAGQKTPIDIPADIQKCIRMWNGSQFDLPQRPPSDPNSLKSQPVRNHQRSAISGLRLADYFVLLCGKVDRVHQRFYYLMLFKFSVACVEAGLSNDGVLVLTDLVLSTGPVTLLQKPKGRVTLEKSDILRKLRRWIDGGERYQLLSQELGGPGILFLLPQNVKEKIWLKFLPKNSSANRITMILSLEERQINDHATTLEAHTAAENFLDFHLGELFDFLSSVYGIIILSKPKSHAISSEPRPPVWSSKIARGGNDFKIRQQSTRLWNPQNPVSLIHISKITPDSAACTGVPLHVTPHSTSHSKDVVPPIIRPEMPPVQGDFPGISSLNKSQSAADDDRSLVYHPRPLLHSSVSSNVHHDLASFSMFPNTTSEETLSSVSSNVHHDLASFSMFPNTTSEETLSSVSSNFHHDVASFSMFPNTTSEETLSSVSSNFHHDVASFSMFPNTTSEETLSSLSSNVHHDLVSFSMFPNTTSEETLSSLSSNVHHDLASFSMSPRSAFEDIVSPLNANAAPDQTITLFSTYY